MEAGREPTAARTARLRDDAQSARAGTVAEVLTQEQGKPLKNAVAEINSAAAYFESTADLQIPAEVLKDDERQRIELRRRPFGVVAAITPWNFPVVLAVWKIAPALLAGNTVILKPSPLTPLSSLMLGEILSDVLPRGVFNIVSGGDALGAWITAHSAVRSSSARRCPSCRSKILTTPPSARTARTLDSAARCGRATRRAARRLPHNSIAARAG